MIFRINISAGIHAAGVDHVFEQLADHFKQLSDNKEGVELESIFLPASLISIEPIMEVPCDRLLNDA